MKSLVLAEKPSVARDIARVLNCHKSISGAIEGNNYIVTWALGHLVTLADPEGYDKKYKEWSLSVLPMVPQKWELVVIRQTAKQYSNVKAQLFRKPFLLTHKSLVCYSLFQNVKAVKLFHIQKHFPGIAF